MLLFDKKKILRNGKGIRKTLDILLAPNENNEK